MRIAPAARLGVGRFVGVIGVLAVVALGSACSSGSSSVSTGTTLGGGSEASGSGGGASGGGTSTSSASTGCTEPAAATVPDGQWTGPIVVDVDAANSRASGEVTSMGDGSLDLVVSGGQVTGTKWSLNASSQGQMEISGTSATVNGTLELKDGTVGGTASNVTLDGTAQISGSITINVRGANIDQPLNGTYSGATTMTIVSATCDQVIGSFIPAWAARADAQAGGVKTFAGQYRWTGHRA